MARVHFWRIWTGKGGWGIIVQGVSGSHGCGGLKGEGITQVPVLSLVPSCRHLQDVTLTAPGSVVVENGGQGVQRALEPTVSL